ncbi:MAG: hypothetical protein AELANPGJ_03592 [Anaerolineae bacterium]|nr:hypothetical protein [Anaerolineae bacterium]
MSVGEKVETWFLRSLPVRTFRTINAVRIKRQTEWLAYSAARIKPNSFTTVPNLISSFFAWIGYVLFGLGNLSNYYLYDNSTGAVKDVSSNLASIVRQTMQDPTVIEILESIGALISEPVFSILEAEADTSDEQAIERARRLYATIVAMPALGGLVNSVGEVLTAGQVDNLGAPITQSFWAMGLGFTSWQGISALVTESMLAQQTRYAKSKFRPERFNLSDTIDLYFNGKYNLPELKNALAKLGWRDIDINNLLFLASVKMSRSDIINYFEKNYIDEKTARTKLAQLGYTTEHINFIIREANEEKTQESKSASLTTVKNAFRKRLITENEFKEYLRLLNYSENAIELEINVLNYQENVEQKELSITQLKSAYNTNRINDIEVLSALKELGYTETNAKIIFDTWKTQKAPKVLQLNAGTIKTALSKGILTTEQALSKLQSIGYTLNDAKIIIETVNVSGGGKVKVLTDAQLIEAMQYGFLTQAEVEKRLVERGYNQADSRLLIQLNIEKDKVSLKTSHVLEAFLYDTISEDEAIKKLKELNATEAFIAINIPNYRKRKESFIQKPTPTILGLWYTNNLLDRENMIEKLMDFGYTEENAKLFIENLDIGFKRELTEQSINSAYINDVITADKALELYKQTGLSAENAKIVLDTQDKLKIKLASKISPTTLVSAARNGLLTENELREKLFNLGFNEYDVSLYVALASQQVNETSIPVSKSDILKFYRLGLLNRFDALSALEVKGFSLEWGNLLLMAEKRDISETEIHQAVLNGDLTPEDAVNILLSEGFTDREIEDWLSDILEELG